MADQTGAIDLEALALDLVGAYQFGSLTRDLVDDVVAALERIPKLTETLSQKQAALEASIAERQRQEERIAELEGQEEANADLAHLLEENERWRTEAAFAGGAADMHAERSSLMERERDTAWSALAAAREEIEEAHRSYETLKRSYDECVASASQMSGRIEEMGDENGRLREALEPLVKRCWNPRTVVRRDPDESPLMDCGQCLPCKGRAALAREATVG